MAISRSEDEDRIRIAEILGWINIDWHFDRTIPMHTWLGGTPLGMQTGYIEEIPEYAHDGDAMVTLLTWLAAHYDIVELYSDCGYWFCRIRDIVTLEIIADPQLGYLTPSEAVCVLTLEIGENERA